MTSDDLRVKCIEEQAKAAHRANYNDYTTINGPESWELEPHQDRWINAQTAAFDALPAAGARVVPIEATNEMIKAGVEELGPEYGWTGSTSIWNRMSAAGDLTNPLEKKP